VNRPAGCREIVDRTNKKTKKNKHTVKPTYSKNTIEKTSYPGWPGQETEWPTLYRLRDHTGQATG